ncbi:hypothetical protein, partial [Rhodococcus koreensis]|uniref:hypothetical protein n=1 Tax=Rhodococcus koreensis TaxID=99653 RepID=UPI00366BAC42
SSTATEVLDGATASGSPWKAKAEPGCGRDGPTVTTSTRAVSSPTFAAPAPPFPQREVFAVERGHG